MMEVSLNMEANPMDKIQQFWNGFLKGTGRDPATPYYEAFHFELTERLANELLGLVLSGEKKATASSLKSFEIEGSPLPKPGDLSIVTDYHGNPRCVIETTAVTLIPFKDMTYDICKREGEDNTLESWRRGHQRFYEEEGKTLGYTFTEALLIVFEDFEMIYPKP